MFSAAFVFFSIFLFGGCDDRTDKNPEAEQKNEQLKAVWISYSEFGALPAKSEDDFAEAVDEMFSRISGFSLNTVFVQVRAFSDAFYPSKIFPLTEYIDCGGELSFDPLEIMVSTAKKYSLSLHAWINPFRISYKSDPDALPEACPAKKWLSDNDKGNDTYVYISGSGIFYDPACAQVHKLIYSGIREILEKYDVDGIHIDDYFYPTVEKEIDQKEFSEYKSSGGTLTLDEWRLKTINAFVAGMYKTVKMYGDDKLVSISPGGNIKKNIESYYADVKSWLSNEGFADMLIPQIYFGFENEKFPFEETLSTWKKLKTNNKVTLCAGLAAYKCGKADEYAGTGLNEWTESSDILARQVKLSEKYGYDGFALFSYGSVFNDNLSQTQKKEIAELESQMHI